VAYFKFDRSLEDELRCRGFLGPTMVDQQMRLTIQFCWLSLPEAKRTPEEVENQVRKILERAIRDFRDDYQHFLAGPSAPTDLVS